ncbi:MAG: hypothetical protein IT290_08640 [Deltaproteobacteria bacterium]|nr:hypothetical protein [Deltaproteobacteria bacterium]
MLADIVIIQNRASSKQGPFMKCFVAGLVALLPSVVIAHPYFPIIPGEVTVREYHFRVEGGMKGMPTAPVHGKMVSTVKGVEVREGKQFTRIATEYKDIPYQQNATEIWVREEAGAVIMGALHGEKFVETTLLPAEISVGSEWDYNDGEKSKRKVSRSLALDVQGKRYDDCIEILRVLPKAGPSSATHKDYYCRDVGNVKFSFSMASPAGTYITENELSERR